MRVLEVGLVFEPTSPVEVPVVEVVLVVVVETPVEEVVPVAAVFFVFFLIIQYSHAPGGVWR